MSRIRSVATAAALALALTSTGALPAHAAGAEHLYLAENYDGVEHFDAGAGPCVDWAGSLHEVRHGGYQVVLPPGGQVAGEAHVNGSVDGVVELIPDDPRDPTYTGTYHEKDVVVFLGITSEQDVIRVGHYALATKLSGSDGSTLWLRSSGKITVNGQGRVVVSRDRFVCG